jgi:tetratricopeptide (TPR) repeat protein
MAASFSALDLYEEGLRVSDVTRFSAEFAAGRFEQVVALVREDLALDPENAVLKRNLADAHYFLGEGQEALELYNGLLETTRGRPFHSGGYTMGSMFSYAWLQRQLGNAEEAQKLLALVDRDLEAKRNTSFDKYSSHYVDLARRAWFEGDREVALAWLKKAVSTGMRNKIVFAEPLFEDLSGDAAFAALQAEMDVYLAEERVKTLELICRRNPIPDYWQPLPATCNL